MNKVVYICSAGHSGSTLLDLLIGSHSKVSSLGEISQLPKNLALNTMCTCGKKVRDCSVWTEVVEKLSRELGVSIRDNPYALNLGYYSARVVVDRDQQNITHRIKRKIILGLWYVKLRYDIPIPERIIGKVIEGAGNSFMLYNHVNDLLNTEIVVDSSKNYLKAMSLYKLNPEGVKIILLSRDGRGVFYSGRKRGFSKKESLASWRKYYSRAIPLLQMHVNGKDVLNVSYESLAENPTEALKTICDFIGVEFEDGMLDPSLKVHHVTNGNNMRFKKLAIKPDYSWKEGLSAQDKSYFESKAKRLNEKLGYK